MRILVRMLGGHDRCDAVKWCKAAIRDSAEFVRNTTSAPEQHHTNTQL